MQNPVNAELFDVHPASGVPVFPVGAGNPVANADPAVNADSVRNRPLTNTVSPTLIHLA